MIMLAEFGVPEVAAANSKGYDHVNRLSDHVNKLATRQAVLT